MRRTSSLLAVWLAMIAATSPACPARSAAAQSRAPATMTPASDAARHFDRATTFYLEGDYAAALVEFRRAYELSPSFQVLFDVGQSYFQLRDYANALLTLQRFASEGGDRIGKEDRATLDAELPDLANRVGRVTVVSNLEGATVSIDDQVIGTTPLRDPVLVSAGLRKVSATYAGRAALYEQAAIGGGDSVVLRFEFPPRAPLPPPSPPHEGLAATRPARGSPSYVPTYLSLLVGGAGLAVGSIFGVMAMDEKSRLDQVCRAGRDCPANYQFQIDSLNRDGDVSTIAFGVGAAGVVLGVVLWVAARSAASDSSPLPAASTEDPGRMPVAGATRWRLAPGVVSGSF